MFASGDCLSLLSCGTRFTAVVLCNLVAQEHAAQHYLLQARKRLSVNSIPLLGKDLRKWPEELLVSALSLNAALTRCWTERWSHWAFTTVWE